MVERGPDSSRVVELVDELLSLHGNDEERQFLGAQFDMGLAWAHNPVGDGGLGARPKLQALIDGRLEVAGRRSDWQRNPMGIGMVGPAIANHGTAEQRRRHLRPIFTAEEVWCQLFSEPNAGSDIATLACRAERQGDEWRINGQKVWTSLSAQASFGLLLARTDPQVPKHQGLTAFILDMQLPGVEVRPLRQMTGDAHFSEVFLTDVRVRDLDRLDEVGSGWDVTLTTLMNERVSIGGVVEPRGSGPIAEAIQAWRARSDHEPERRDELVRLWVEAETLRLGNIRAQQLRDLGVPGPEGSILKLGTAVLSQRIMSFTISLKGASGMLAYDYENAPPPYGGDSPAEAFLLSQCNTIAGGTSEIMRNIIGERILGLPADKKVDKGIPWRDIPQYGQT